jgi:peptidoglycan/xylan/chitin deacetylase (PgdA/CDA1 family)
VDLSTVLQVPANPGGTLNAWLQAVSDAQAARDAAAASAAAAQAAFAAGSTTYVPLWKANTAYTAGQYALNPSGQVVSALTGFTTGSSYDSTKWSTPISGGAAIDDSTVSTSKVFSSSKSSSAFSSKVARVINVRDYGAKGDNTTDDTTSIANAIAALLALSTSGGTIYFPPGTFITSTVTIPATVTLAGDGDASVLKLAPGTNGDLVTVPDGNGSTTVRNLVLDGNKGSNTSGRGLVYNQPNTGSFHRVASILIRNTAGDGFVTTGTAAGASNFTNVRIYSCDGRGAVISSHDSVYTGWDVGQSGLFGFNVVAAANNKFASCNAWFSGRITHSSGAGWYISGGSKRNNFIGCQAQDSQAESLNIYQSDQNTFEGFVSDSANSNGAAILGDQNSAGVKLNTAIGNTIKGTCVSRGSVNTTIYALSISGATCSGNVVELQAENMRTGAVTGAIGANRVKVSSSTTAYNQDYLIVTPAAGDNSTAVATTAFVSTAVANLVNAAPTALDTLGELATQMQSDESAAAALTTLVGQKAATTALTAETTRAQAAEALLAPLASPALTGTPTAPTAAAGTSSTQVASTGFVAANALSLTDAASQQLAADGVSLASPWQEFVTRTQRPASKVVFRFNGSAGFTTTTKVTEDTSTVLFGDRTMKIAAVANDNIATDSPTFTAQDWSASTIRLWLKMDTPANWSQSVMYVYMTGGGIASVGISANFQAGEWIPVTIPRVQFSTAAGTLNWASVTKITVTNVAASTGPVTLWLGGVDLVPDLASTYASGVMVCEMDDGFAGQFTYGLPVFASRGIPVTYNVIGANFVGSPSVTGKYAADLRTLQDIHGWQISCHAYSTAVHTGPSTTAQLEADFQRQKQWLHANGLHAGTDHYALCPGTGSPVPAGTLMDALRKTFRSVRVNSGYYETAAYADPLRLRSVLFSGAGNNVTNVKANIDKAAGAGGAFIFAMHDIIAGATDGTSGGIAAIAQTNLATILDYAASKGMVFRTRADLIDGR